MVAVVMAVAAIVAAAVVVVNDGSGGGGGGGGGGAAVASAVGHSEHSQLPVTHDVADVVPVRHGVGTAANEESAGV